MKTLILPLIFIALCKLSQGQTKYDTSLYVRVTVTKIEQSMKVGNWLTVQSDKGEIKYAAIRTVDKETRRNKGTCVLMAKDIWDKLSVTKN